MRRRGWRECGFVTTGKMKGNHQLEVDVSYDDGVHFIPCVSAPLAITTAGGFAVGDTVSKRWFPRRRKGEGAVVRIRMTTNGTVTEGETLSNLLVEVIRNKKARRAVKQQG
jgi:hypothetical protein